MFNHILVPIVPGHGAEYEASMTAARNLLNEGGRISALSILEELPSYVGSYFPKDQMQKSIDIVTGELHEQFGADDVEIHVVAGHSTNSILSWQKKHKPDCIVVSSHRPGLSDLLLGSTAARVTRHASCSVVVIR